MEQEIHITLRFNLATGKANLNEIVYELKNIKNPLMLKILEQILRGYNDLISEHLSQTKIYPSKAGKGLGRYVRKGGPEGRLCRLNCPHVHAFQRYQQISYSKVCFDATSGHILLIRSAFHNMNPASQTSATKSVSLFLWLPICLPKKS